MALHRYTTMTLLRGVVAAAVSSALVVAACGDDSGAYTYMDDELPSGEECDTDGMPSGDTDGCVAASTGAPPDGGVGSPCGRTGECNSGLVCSAPFDGQRGEFACVDVCIGIMDEARWCADASACCDPNATCTPRGYCVVEGDDSTTTSSTTADTSSDGSSTDGSTSADGSTGSTGDTGTTGTTG